MAILGTGRRGVNENGTTMGCAAPKSRILWIIGRSRPVVYNGSNFESVFCGLSPPAFGGRIAGLHLYLRGHRALVL